jgi:hypothetical protein
MSIDATIRRVSIVAGVLFVAFGPCQFADAGGLGNGVSCSFWYIQPRTIGLSLVRTFDAAVMPANVIIPA